MTRWIRTAILALSIIVAGCAPAAPPAEVASVTPAEVRQMQLSEPPPLMLDVRSPEEFAAGHVPGAIHIPFEQVTARVHEVEAAPTIVVYCAVGPRARKGEASLLAAGVDAKRVRHMEGGMIAWEAAGLPVER